MKNYSELITKMQAILENEFSQFSAPFKKCCLVEKTLMKRFGFKCIYKKEIMPL